MGAAVRRCISSVAVGWFAAVGWGQPFRITVVDAQTGRGVPLVELTTTNGIASVTDSTGVVAFDEPGLMGVEGGVWFGVKSHGYTYKKDGLGMAGVTLDVKRGGSAVIKVDRVNIAERLYRVTGEGVYRDSVLLGDKAPVKDALLNGKVMGQDSVQNAVYNGKLYWFWGDTAQVRYPLGNFGMSGAVSALPGAGGGGLDPDVGVDLTYFVGKDGFSRPMIVLEKEGEPRAPGPVWCDGFVVVQRDDGKGETMLCHWARMKSLGEVYEQGFARWNDSREVFEPVSRIALDAPLFMRGHPLAVRGKDGAWVYFPAPFPLSRCREREGALLDVGQYEAYTCLVEGTRYAGASSKLERDAGGKLVYGWKKGTDVVGQKEQRELVEKGLMKKEEGLIQLRDGAGKEVLAGAGSVFWNSYRKAYVMIVQEVWGSSMCGETWFVEAPSPVGPWGRATKVVTHDDYSFYNVRQHPEFEKEGGRVIYFEGTYTMAFSGAKVPTARYDYNQVMYRLDLGDERLGGK